MEALGRATAFWVYTVLVLLSGVEGKSLLLPVETLFPLDQAKIQGSWSQTNVNGTRIVLVTFTNDTSITDMLYQARLTFQEPNASLLIQRLDVSSEGDYHLDLNILFHNGLGPVKERRTVHVKVDVPVSTPVIMKSPSEPVVEDQGNVTLSCSVERGTRVQYDWLRDDVLVGSSDRHWFSKDHAKMKISLVRKEDMGSYRCVARNKVNQERSTTLDLSLFYGPYNLEVNSEQGQRTGEVFTISPSVLAFFNCQADSNPPNSFVWTSKSLNSSTVIPAGPRLMVQLYRSGQTEEYLCRAFNNVTRKQDETKITVVVASPGTGTEKHTKESGSVSPLAAITVCSLFIIGCMVLLFFQRKCHPKRVIMKIYNKPLTEQKRPHLSGHEDAADDFGIYEFVSIPGKMESTLASSRSLAHLESAQDLHTTIYDVIRHIPETPNQSLLK
ncbi:HEPACAM family member 2 [Aplochiton taeniatus]